MVKKSGASKQDLKVAEFLRLGGLAKPTQAKGKLEEAIRKMQELRAGKSGAVREQGAKLYRELKGVAPVAVKDPVNKKALDGLLGWHKNLAGKKLAPIHLPPGFGGISPWRIGGTVVPPFELTTTIPTGPRGDMKLDVSSNPNGQISASAVTGDTISFNMGSEYATVGFYFHPMTVGTLRAWAAPTYSFQWWTNSLNAALVASSGSIQMAIFGFPNGNPNIITASAGTNIDSWDLFEQPGVNLGFKFGVQGQGSAQLDVNPETTYMVFVSIDAAAFGMGWPGSLGGAQISATVPSISWEFDMRQVFEP